MEPTDHETFLQKVVRLQRLIFLALIAGVCVFGTMMMVIHFAAREGKGIMPDPPQVAGFPILTLVVGVVASGSLAAGTLLPNATRRQIVRHVAGQPAQDAPATRSALLTGWQGGNLIRAGLLEGPAILSLVLFLVTGDYALLAIAGIMVAVLIANVPSEASARRWLNAAEEELEQVRRSG